MERQWCGCEKTLTKHHHIGSLFFPMMMTKSNLSSCCLIYGVVTSMQQGYGVKRVEWDFKALSVRQLNCSHVTEMFGNICRPILGLLLVLEVCNVQSTVRKPLAANLLVVLHGSHLSQKVKFPVFSLFSL